MCKLANWSAVAAATRSRVIGCGDEIPWNIELDKIWFRVLVRGQINVMGRKTFERIKRLDASSKYLVLTHNKGYCPITSNAKVIFDVSEIPNSSHVWICGGEELYMLTLNLCRFLFLTTIKQEFEGNKYLPEFKHEFELVGTLFEDEKILIQKFKNKRW